MSDTSVGLEAAAQAIADDAQLLAEALSARPAIEAACGPAGPRGVVEALAPLLAVFGGEERAQADAFWSVYIGALQEMPPPALRAAAEAYTMKPDSKYFPKPGELLALARRAVCFELMAAGRVRRAAQLAEQDRR